MGLPPADIVHSGPSIVAYAGSQEEAEKVADGLLQHFLDVEHICDSALIAANAAVAEATAHAGRKPVVL
jgi:microcystin degradation protein MlrC